MDLKSAQKIDSAVNDSRKEFSRLGLAFLFLAGILAYVATSFQLGQGSLVLSIAAVVGGYMAMNIGANDVANNVGPAVGSKALTLTWAIIIAAIFEAGGALLAGGEVVSTIKKGIINPENITDSTTFIWLMLSALFAGAVWLNAATHIAVGGIFGVGFLREYLKTSYASQLHTMLSHHEGEEKRRLSEFLDDFKSASVEEMEKMLQTAKQEKKALGFNKVERKRLKKIYKEKLVKRSAFKKIIAAWLITVPASAALAATVFTLISGFSI